VIRTAYWTTSRYAPEVLDSVGMAVDIFRARGFAKSMVT
jgi:hypothetical protein